MLRVWGSLLGRKFSRVLIWALVPPTRWYEYRRCDYVASYDLGRCVLRKTHWGWHRTFPDDEYDYPIAW